MLNSTILFSTIYILSPLDVLGLFSPVGIVQNICLEYLLFFLTSIGLDSYNSTSLFDLLDLFDLFDLDFDLGYSDDSDSSESEYEWPSDSEDWSSEGEDWDDRDDNKPVPANPKPISPVLPEVTKPEPADVGHNNDK